MTYNAEYIRNWRKKNPEKVKENKRRQRIRERGDKVRRSAWRNDYRKKEKFCANCKTSENLEFHHTNYEEHQGITLCMKCHRELHKILKGG